MTHGFESSPRARRKRPGVARGADVDPRLVVSRLLHQGNVDRRRLLALHFPEAGAVHDANDLHVLVIGTCAKVDLAPDRVFRGKEPPGETLANNCYARSALVITPVELPACQQPHSDQFEEARADEVFHGLHRSSRRGGDRCRLCELVEEGRPHMRVAYGLDSGELG